LLTDRQPYRHTKAKHNLRGGSNIIKVKVSKLYDIRNLPKGGLHAPRHRVQT